MVFNIGTNEIKHIDFTDPAPGLDQWRYH